MTKFKTVTAIDEIFGDEFKPIMNTDCHCRYEIARGTNEWPKVPGIDTLRTTTMFQLGGSSGLRRCSPYPLAHENE